MAGDNTSSGKSAAMTKRRAPDLRLPYEDLVDFSSTLFRSVGFPHDRARTVSALLVKADMLGISTHGLILLPFYLDAARKRDISLRGTPRLVRSSPCSEFWDAKRASGQWVIHEAMNRGIELAQASGLSTMIVRRSHHVGALAPHVLRAASAGFVGLMMCSDPSSPNVAPHGGSSPLLGTNPIAAAFPSLPDPLIIDVSTASITAGQARKALIDGEMMRPDSMVTALGKLTTDPGILFRRRPGAILPLGGTANGHKGFSLAVLVELLTVALGGLGSKSARRVSGTSTWLMLIDPSLFGGRSALNEGIRTLRDVCSGTHLRKGYRNIRLPGEYAMACHTSSVELGVPISTTVLKQLDECAERQGVPSRIMTMCST